MQQLIIFKLSQLRLYLLIITVFGWFLLTTTHLSAASPTPTATTSASPIVETASPSASDTIDDQTIKSLKERIDRVIETKVQTRNRQGQIRVVFGTIQKFNDESLTIKTFHGSESFTLDSKILLTKDQRRITIEDLAIDDQVMVAGEYNANDDFEPRRIELSTKPFAANKPALFVGNLTSTNKNFTQATLTGVNQSTITVAISKDSLFVDGSNQSFKKEQLSQDNQYLVAMRDTTTTPLASLIYSFAPVKRD